jgi:hypothetical protein
MTRNPSENEMKSDVTKYLKNKITQKLNVADINLLPLLPIKEGDITNWPSSVKFIPIYKMKGNDLKTIHELVKEDQLDFSPEFRRRLEVQTRGNSNDFGNYLPRIAEIPHQIDLRTTRKTIPEDEASSVLPLPDGIYFYLIFRLLS